MTSPHARTGWFDGERAVLVVAGLFFLAGLVWLGSSANYPGDERYYTDAALRMLERGEWWTPVYADGTVRANKPLLTYWAVMLGFASTGVSLVVARLPFLIAGAVLVWLTGRLARRLFPDEPRAGLVAALVVASDYELVTLAVRSTPDILLVVCATASLYGLARWLRGDGTRSAAAWFWLGGALAIAAKGGLGLVVLGFGIVVALFDRRVRPKRALFPIPILLAAVAIAITGLAPSLLLEARPGAPTFLDDQVGARLSGSVGEVLQQLGRYLVSLARHFLPWVVFAGLAVAFDPGRARERWKTSRREVGIALAWCLLLLVVFSCSNTHRGRYLAPAHPLLATVLAPFLLDFARRSGGARTLRGLGLGLVVLLGLVGLLVARVDPWTGAGILVAPAGYLLGRRAFAGECTGLAGLALLLLAVFAVGARGVSALVNPSPFPLVARRLVSEGVSRTDRVATLGLPENAASLLRMSSGGRIDPVTLPAGFASSEGERFPILILEEGEWQGEPTAGQAFEPLAGSPTERPPARLLLQVFLSRGARLVRLFEGPRLGRMRPIGTVR